MRAPFPRPDLPLGLGLGLSTVAMGNPRWVSELPFDRSVAVDRAGATEEPELPFDRGLRASAGLD